MYGLIFSVFFFEGGGQPAKSNKKINRKKTKNTEVPVPIKGLKCKPEIWDKVLETSILNELNDFKS